MNMALSVEGSQCQARPCGLFCEEWVPPNTCGYLRVACCPWLSSGARTELEALAMLSHKGPSGRPVVLDGKNLHFERWLLTLITSFSQGIPHNTEN